MLKSSQITLLAGLALVGLAGCTPLGPLKDGPPIEFDPAKITAYASRQDQMIAALAQMAHLPTVPALYDPNWNLVIRAGINYSDMQCEQFIEAIFKYDRETKVVSKELTLIGSTTTVVLGLVKAMADELALTAAIFGLASGTLNNVSGSVLFAIEPSRIRETVETLQAAYRLNVQVSDYRTRTAAVEVIAGYHALCLPASIEAEINQKVGGSGSEVAKANVPGSAPVVLPPSDMPVIEYAYSADADAEAIINAVFVPPSYAVSTKGFVAYQECIVNEGLSATLSVWEFTSDAKYRPRYPSVHACMKKKGV